MAIPLSGLAPSSPEEVYGIQDVMCNGTENRLEECQYSTTISDICDGAHVAGVRCVDCEFIILCVNQWLSSSIR